MSKRGINRRDLLGLGIVGGASFGMPWFVAKAQADTNAVPISGKPKNIIFMVSDGMSIGIPSLAEPFSKMVRDKGTIWYELLGDPTIGNGHFETHSLTGLVTDSAAGAVAWSSGSRVFNGSINVLPDGTKMTPIGTLAKQSGRRVGLVTTTQITHATPAAFASVVPDRGQQEEIATQYLNKVDVLMGGGREHFVPSARKDEVDLVAKYKSAGYAHWNSRDALKAGTRQGKILGLFGSGHLPMTIDQNHNEDFKRRVPTLAEMTTAALETLSASDDGFLLQVEGGRVDHAAHINDAAGALWDQLAFDDAVRVAVDFARKSGDTLVVVTVDHGNANPGLNGSGGNYADSTRRFENLANIKASSGVLVREIVEKGRKSGSVVADGTVDVIKEITGITISAEEAETLAKSFNGDKSVEVFAQHKSEYAIVGEVLGNHTGIGWTGMSHTADMVLVSAVGPGCEQFNGLNPNTHAFDAITKLWDIDHKNPSMTSEQAKAFAAMTPRVDEVHWV